MDPSTEQASQQEPENEDNVRDNYFNPEKIVECKKCKQRCEPFENPGLMCDTCFKYVHMNCLRDRISVPKLMIGDVFFNFCCCECHPLEQDDVSRDDHKMSWLAVVVLVLYFLRETSSGISNQGFFHWRDHIVNCIGQNWASLFPKPKKKTGCWVGTVSGTLSQYKGQCLESGFDCLNTNGWWKLMSQEPPEVIMYRNKKKIKLGKKKKATNLEQEMIASYSSVSPSRSDSVSSADFNQVSQPSSRLSSPTLSESNSSANDGSNFGTEPLPTIQTPSMFSREYVQPSEFLSDCLFDGDDPMENLLDDDDDESLDLTDCSEYYDELKKEYQDQKNNQSMSKYPRNFSEFNKHWSNFKEEKNLEEQDEDEEDDLDEDSSGSEEINREPQVSLFHQTSPRTEPWKKHSKLGKIRPRMSKYEENYILATMKKYQLDLAPPSIRRLYRKLSLRKIKRDSNLPLFDFDNTNFDSSQKIASDKKNRIIDRFYNERLGMIFEQRLQGFMEPHSVLSPHTGRLLKPFIRRDRNCQPLWLRVMEELKAKVNGKNPNWIPEPIATIDYCYVKPQHIPAMNSLCEQFFWAGVDLTECLQYPDTTCVVLYKKLVIGFAVMIPDIDHNTAYISFVFTRPEWRRAGIGNFMMYHLTQTYMKKDLTLHVSVTNPALMLYQKFGFKVEEFIQDFYDKYMAPGPRESCHAFFLRLCQ